MLAYINKLALPIITLCSTTLLWMLLSNNMLLFPNLCELNSCVTHFSNLRPLHQISSWRCWVKLLLNHKLFFFIILQISQYFSRTGLSEDTCKISFFSVARGRYYYYYTLHAITVTVMHLYSAMLADALSALCVKQSCQ